MKNILLISLISATGLSFGQPADLPNAKDEKPPLPSPILRRAPELSQWTIRMVKPASSSGASANAQGGSAGETKDSPPSSKTVVKSGKTYYEIEVDDAGAKWEKWNVNGTQVTLNVATGKAVVASSGMDSLYYCDYSTKDFAGFGWISPANYVAFKSLGKSKCFIFQEELKLYDGTTGVRMAAIDSETQLPVLLDIDGNKSVYQFAAPPAVPLTVPEKVKALLAPEPPPKVAIPRALQNS